MSSKRLIPTTALVAAAGGIFVGGSLAAGAEEAVDTSRWQCRFCVFPEGWRGDIRAGVGYVSEDSAKFGEYSDLDEEEAYPVLGGEAAFYGREGFRWDATIRDLALDTRRIDLSGGRQGRYELGLSYDGIVRHVSDSARTPFRDAGGVLALPAGWTRAASTGAMSDLAAGLHDVDLGTRRRRAGLDLLFRPSDNWSYSFNARREERDGRKTIGAGFIASAAQLPAEVDEKTEILDLGARYTAELWSLNLSYHGSFFDNERDRLAWDNPYSLPGPERGRTSTAPDNQAHRVGMSGTYRFGARTFFTGDVSVGRMRQDEDLLPFTSNPDLAVPALLPRGSADAEIDTLTANGRLTHRTRLPRLSLVFDYRIDRRDNDTPRDAFVQAVTDSFIGEVRINEPLSYDRYRAGVEANYRLSGYGRLSGGFDYKRFARDYGADPVTDEYELWTRYRTRLNGVSEVRIMIAHAERTGDNRDPLSAAPTGQNPRMTWFDVADRSRTALDVELQVSPAGIASIGVSSRLVDDEYDDTVIGRTGSMRLGFGLDFSARPRDDMSLYGYLNHDRYRTEQRNSATFSAPNWQGATEDAYVTAGLGGEMTGIGDRFDLGLAIIYMDAAGEIDVDTGSLQPGFPDLETKRFSARLRGETRLRENLRLGMSLGYERYRSEAWMLDDVEPDTVARLLALGEDDPSYDAVTGILSIEYGF